MLGFYAALIGSLATDISAENVSPALKGQAVQKEVVTDRLSPTAIGLRAELQTSADRHLQRKTSLILKVTMRCLFH